MSGARRKAPVFVESNTSGTGALFVRVAREMGFRPVLVSANPGRYAFVHAPGAPEVIELPGMDEDALEAAIRSAPAAGAGVAAARDKSWRRRALAAGGVAVPAFRVVERADAAAHAAALLAGGGEDGADEASATGGSTGMDRA